MVTAMVTPFKQDFSLDVDRAQELARWLAEHGTDALVVTGCTGEAATMTDEEKVTLWGAVAEAVQGRAQVIAGTGTYGTAHSIHLTEPTDGMDEYPSAAVAERAGVDPKYVDRPLTSESWSR